MRPPTQRRRPNGNDGVLTHPPTRAPEGLPLRGTARKRPRAPGGETAPEARRPRARASVTPREQEPGCRKACAAATADTHPALRPPGPAPHGTHRNHTPGRPARTTTAAPPPRAQYVASPGVQPRRLLRPSLLRRHPGSPAQVRCGQGRSRHPPPHTSVDPTAPRPPAAVGATCDHRPPARGPARRPPNERTVPPAHPARCRRGPAPRRRRCCSSPQTTRTRHCDKAAPHTDRPHTPAAVARWPSGTASTTLRMAEASAGTDSRPH
ncbi:hypothetical protein CLV63_1502 [Murinocardiopsis flavida]|uniref:Uncharacterized protein n=1 Tax=Murinocardiopsis flavida TaxID=645275 RepID=A0A2P8C7U7_9ACTN|nr:hypothetical protein CLV63_1502 [Murinocardiopsis flavida]